MFYLSWFTRCYRQGECGWFAFNTPDGDSFMEQDGFFWRATEIICQEMNVQLAHAREKAINRGKS